jgi:hypothetical protein
VHFEETRKGPLEKAEGGEFPLFRPPFDIIWRLAQEARKHQEENEVGGGSLSPLLLHHRAYGSIYGGSCAPREA